MVIGTSVVRETIYKRTAAILQAVLCMCRGLMRKKWMYILLCMAFSALLAAGCEGKAGKPGQEDFGADRYKEFITVDVYDEFSNYQGIQSGWFAKVVRDRFNMELNMIAPNVAGGGDTLYQTRAATGDLGDLVVINTANGKLSELAEAGLIMDCTELMKDTRVMKNYAAAVEKTNELVEGEGIYGFPNSISSQPATAASESQDPTFGPFIRWDYYKKAGYPKMENLDEFLDVLEQIQALAREEEGKDGIYAISLFRDWDDNMMNNAKQLACMYGYDEQGFVLSRADGTDYQNIIDDGSLYIRALRFLNEANARGLVDPDSASQNYDMWLEKYREGKTLYSPWPWVGQSTFNTAENKEAGKGFKLAAVQDMQIFSFGCWPEGDSKSIIAIGSQAEDPQRLADFIDWLYSPEGFELNGQANGAAGPEGLTWELGADDKPVLTEFGKTALPNNQVDVPEEYGGGKWKAGVSALNFRTFLTSEIDPNTGSCYDYLCWDSTLEKSGSELDRDWKEKMGTDTSMEYLEQNDMVLVAPGANYSTPAEDANITTVRGQCKSAVVDYSWQLIFAEADEFDRLLKDFQNILEGLGYEDVYEVDLENAKAQTAARKAVAGKYSD